MPTELYREATVQKVSDLFPSECGATLHLTPDLERRQLKKFFYAYRMYTTPLELMELVTDFYNERRNGMEKR